MSNTNNRWRKRHPEAYAAHILLASAVRNGTVTKGSCVECGEAKTHGHHDDYTKPLDVVWVCSKHHRYLHAKRKGQTIHGPRTTPPPRAGRKKHQPAPKRDALLADAITLRASGSSYKAISTALNVGVGTVYKWLNNTDYT